jgi:CubicO group peptidase (beta-lactamase class C family)
LIVRTLRFLLLFVPVLGILPSVSAQSNDKSAGINQEVLARIAPRMKAFAEQHVVAGSVSLVAHGDDVVEFDASGMADIEAGQPMRKDTIFQIMSMTKPVTAVGIMMLAEQGKLALRDPVELYLPEFRGAKVATTTGPDAGTLSLPNHAFTIRDLLTHTAGIQDYPGPPSIPDYAQTMSVPLEDVVKQLAKQPLLFQPGTQWSYSSPGIEILGRIIEVVSGEKYADFITGHVLKPLGMKDSFFFPPADKVSRIAMVYASNEGKLVPAPGTILGGDPARHRQGAIFPAPGWGLYSTAEDLLHFYRMMLNDGVYDGHRYLSPFSVHVMTEPQTSGIHPVGWMRGSDYGLAWEVVTDPLGELAGHTVGTYGHGGAFGTQGWIDPENRLISILLIQNATGGAESMTNVFLNMAEASVGK